MPMIYAGEDRAVHVQEAQEEPVPGSQPAPREPLKPSRQLPAVKSSEESQSADRLQTRQYQPFLQHHCVN